MHVNKAAPDSASHPLEAKGARCLIRRFYSACTPWNRHSRGSEIPNHTRHEWARWDAYIYTLDPDALFDEFSQRGASFVKKLSFIDEGLWGFEVTDADGYVLAFFHLRNK